MTIMLRNAQALAFDDGDHRITRPVVLPVVVERGTYRLAATLYRPARYGRYPTVIINGGMAMPRQFYSRIAQWIASQGYACLTYDYSGMFGSSDAQANRCSRVTLSNWAEDDLNAIVAWCRNQCPGSPLLMLAHSFGGVLLTLSSSIQAFDGVVLVNSGSAYWGCHASRRHRAKRFALAHMAIPALTQLFGYFPGKALGVLGDIPKEVAMEASKWSRQANYMLDLVDDCKGFRLLDAPALSLAFEDDDIFPVEAVQWLASRFERPVPVEVMRTQDVGQVGHFDFFSPQVGARLWPALKLWFDCALGTQAWSLDE